MAQAGRVSVSQSVIFLYITLAHQGDGVLTEEEMEKIRALTVRWSGEYATPWSERYSNFEHNLKKSFEWYDRAIQNGGRELVFKQFSINVNGLVRDGNRTPGGPLEGAPPEMLALIYDDLVDVASIDGEISAGETTILKKTAKAWGLKDLKVGEKLEPFGSDGYEYPLAWPIVDKSGNTYDEDGNEINNAYEVGYYGICAEVFMLATIASVGDDDITEGEMANIGRQIEGLRKVYTWYTREEVDRAVHATFEWFNSVLHARGKDDVVKTFHQLGDFIADRFDYNPNTLNSKNQNLRDCCEIDGKVSKREKEIMDKLSESWNNVSKDWSERLPRYVVDSEYQESDIIGTW